MKIYVAAVEALWEKEKRGAKTNSVYHKNWWFFWVSHSPTPSTPTPRMVRHLFGGFFNLALFMSKLPNSGFWCCVFLTLQITLMCPSVTPQYFQEVSDAPFRRPYHDTLKVANKVKGNYLGLGCCRYYSMLVDIWLLWPRSQ